MKKFFNITSIILIVICSIIFFAIYQYSSNNLMSDVKNYLDEVYKIERGFIENIPIYDDFATASKEKQLRKYLNPFHLKAAKKFGIGPIKNNDEIKSKIEAGELVSIDQDEDKLYYFYNVKKENRYLTPGALEGIKKITSCFQENINKRKNLPPVKFAISSAVRSGTYQKNLSNRNANAVIKSTHSAGVSLDIFFDDYFVKLPLHEGSNKASMFVLEKLRNKFGFLLGDSLRRQFRTILMETLIQLQDEGWLYAILERNQRCYHVTILR